MNMPTVVTTISYETIKDLHARAAERHGHIEPCYGRSWPECLTVEAGMVMLWYNDERGSTHIVTAAADGVA